MSSGPPAFTRGMRVLACAAGVCILAGALVLVTHYVTGFGRGAWVSTADAVRGLASVCVALIVAERLRTLGSRAWGGVALLALVAAVPFTAHVARVSFPERFMPWGMWLVLASQLALLVGGIALVRARNRSAGALLVGLSVAFVVLFAVHLVRSFAAFRSGSPTGVMYAWNALSATFPLLLAGILLVAHHRAGSAAPRLAVAAVVLAVTGAALGSGSMLFLYWLDGWSPFDGIELLAWSVRATGVGLAQMGVLLAVLALTARDRREAAPGPGASAAHDPVVP